MTYNTRTPSVPIILAVVAGLCACDRNTSSPCAGLNGRFLTIAEWKQASPGILETAIAAGATHSTTRFIVGFGSSSEANVRHLAADLATRKFDGINTRYDQHRDMWEVAAGDPASRQLSPAIANVWLDSMGDLAAAFNACFTGWALGKPGA